MQSTPVALFACVLAWAALQPTTLVARETPVEDVATTFTRPAAAVWIEERWWTTLYLQVESSSHDRDNIVTDPVLRTGFHAFTIADRWIDLYFKARGFYDRNQDFWNNRTETGVGARVFPFENLGLVLFYEVLYGRYTGRAGIDMNPDDSPYWDVQGGAAFWQWWGRYPWEVEENELYWPLTGWRELYWDAIYYRRDDGNVIGTLEYKEGLALGRVGPVQWDAFISLDAGADTHHDYWNNYAKLGPGLRMTPFENLDLKLSVEYFLGKYWGGDTRLIDDTFGELVFTLAFYCEF